MAKASLEIFSQNLQRLMAREDMDLNDFAVDLGVTRDRARQWTGAKCFPNEAGMVKICELFEYYDIFKLITELIDFKKLKTAI